MTSPAPKQYDQSNENLFRSSLSRIFANVFHKNADVEIGGARLILKDTVDGQRYSLTIASGVVTVVGPL